MIFLVFFPGHFQVPKQQTNGGGARPATGTDRSAMVKNCRQDCRNQTGEGDGDSFGDQRAAGRVWRESWQWMSLINGND